MALKGRNIWAVYLKETRDTLRDRRTLFAAIVLPIIINPLLFIGLFMLMTSQTAEQRRQEFSLVIVGAEQAPKLSRLLQNFTPPQTLGAQFDVPLPDAPIRPLKPAEERHISVTLYPSPTLLAAADADGDGRVGWEEFWRHQQAAAASDHEVAPLDEAAWRELFAAFDHDDSGFAAAPPLAELRQAVEAGEHQVVLVFPDQFEALLGQKTKQQPVVHYLGSSDRSTTAQQLVTQVLRRYVEPFTPVEVVAADVREGSQEIRMIARFIPYLIILMVLTAAFTPAIDLMAGEKERGTIETLLISPADRRELILGKFFCVASVAVAATALNLASLAITVGVIGNMLGSMMKAAPAAVAAPAEPGSEPETVVAAGDAAEEPAAATTDADADATTDADAGADAPTDEPAAEAGDSAASAAPVSDGSDAAEEPADEQEPAAHTATQPGATAESPPPAAEEAGRPTDGVPNGLMPGQGSGSFLDVPPILYPIVFLLMVPAAALFGAIALAISAFAKSYKEGQYYITPMMMVAIPLAMISLLPGIEYNWRWGLVPIANFSLLFRDLLTEISTLGYVTPLMWGYIAQVVAVTGLYAYLGLRWATSNFYREDILFREAEEFNWKVWKVPGPKRVTPSAAAAGFAFVVALILYFFVGQSWMIEALKGLSESVEAAMRRFAVAHVLNQALLIAGPAILLTWINGYRFRRVFWLGPRPSVLAVLGLLSAVAGTSVLLIGLFGLLQQAFGGGAESMEPMQRMAEQLSGWGVQGILLVVLFLAVVPGIFEELLFRGYILTGMLPDRVKDGRARRADGTLPTPWKAILLTAALFGLMHLTAIRIPITFLGGVLIGWVAWRTRSIVMAMAAHIFYNSLPVLFEGTQMNKVLLDSDGTTLSVPLWLWGVGAGLLIAGVALIHTGTRHLQHLLPGERRPMPKPQPSLAVADGYRAPHTPM